MTIETPPNTPTEDATAAQDSAVRSCPRCSAPLEPDQDWCLSCGAAVTTRIERPPSWRVPVALVAAIAALALGAVGVAFFAVAEDPDLPPATQTTATAPEATTPTTPTTPTPPADGAGTTPAVPSTDGAASGDPATGDATTDDGTTTDGTTDDGTTTDGTTGDGTAGTGDPAATADGLQPWPEGESAFTVVLYSADTRADAEARAEDLTAAGTAVGILNSDDYPSLRPGYWVLFSGQYETREEAQTALETLVGAAPDAYVRRVEPA